MRTELSHIACLLFLRAKKPVSIAPAVLCSGLTNEIQCLIVITRKDLALRTKTNQQASSKENRMEVRLVIVASRGFFFSLSRGSRSRLHRSQSQLRYEKKKTLWHPGYFTAEGKTDYGCQ